MHKTYRKQNGKTFGPYYYATIRTKDGKTKSIYLGKNRSEALDNQAKLTHVRNEEKARKKWRFRIYMEQLFRYLESNNITSFLIREVPNPSHVGMTHDEKGEAVSFLSDGIIVLYNVIYDDGSRGRAIEVLKMRGEDIQRRIAEAAILDRMGIVVYPQKTLKGTYRLT